MSRKSQVRILGRDGPSTEACGLISSASPQQPCTLITAAAPTQSACTAARRYMAATQTEGVCGIHADMCCGRSVWTVADSNGDIPALSQAQPGIHLGNMKPNSIEDRHLGARQSTRNCALRNTKVCPRRPSVYRSIMLLQPHALSILSAKRCCRTQSEDTHARTVSRKGYPPHP